MEYVLRKGYPLRRREFDERIAEAERHIFSLGLGDAAEEVGRVNAALFLAKLHYLQEQLGYDRHAMFIGTPDFTFQTSPYKFRDAVPEGGKLIWGDGGYNLIPAEIEPDFCGLLVGTVEDSVSLEEILDSLYSMSVRDNCYINGVKVKLENFRPGSHFLNVYRVEGHEALNLPEIVAVLHTSSSEMRDQLTNFVRERGEMIWTPFGRTYLLRDGDAREYEKRCRYADEFSEKKRSLLFQEIFGHGETLLNKNHYTLIGLNEAIIGCHTIHDQGELLPVMLVEDSPAYLVRGRMNLSQEIIEQLFGSKRLESWVYERLSNANIAPHGGGHRLIDIEGIWKVILYPQAKVIIPKAKNHVKAYVDMETAFRNYRFKGILERIQSLGLADHYATLRPVYGVKVDFFN